MFDIPWYIFALLAAFFVALVSVFEKKVLVHEDPLHFAGSTTFIVGLLSFPFLFFVDWESISLSSFLSIYAISLLAAVAFYTTSVAMRGLEAGELSIILALTPAATAVFAFLTLGEALSPQSMVGIGVIIFSLMVLEFPSLWKSRTTKRFNKKIHYILVAFFSIFVYACSAVLDRVVLGHAGVRPVDFLAIVQVLALFNFSVFSFFRPVRERLLTKTFTHAPFKMIAISILLVLSRLMYSHAVSLAYAALAAVLKRTGALFTIVLARSYLKEHGVGHKLFVAGIMLLGVALIVL